MRLVVALTCLLAGCLAQSPQPCKSPPLMTGSVTVLTQNEKLLVYIRYLYDEVGQRMRLWAKGIYEKKPFEADYLLHYKEKTLYKIVDSTRTCEKLPLKADFQPLGVPQGASLVGQPVLGNSTTPGDGLKINVWRGDLPENAGKFQSSVTDIGCFPIGSDFQTVQYGWTLLKFFNNVVGISDPSQLNAPDFCPQAETIPEGEPEEFLHLFLKLKN